MSLGILNRQRWRRKATLLPAEPPSPSAGCWCFPTRPRPLSPQDLSISQWSDFQGSQWGDDSLPGEPQLVLCLCPDILTQTRLQPGVGKHFGKFSLRSWLRLYFVRVSEYYMYYIWGNICREGGVLLFFNFFTWSFAKACVGIVLAQHYDVSSAEAKVTSMWP